MRHSLDRKLNAAGERIPPPRSPTEIVFVEEVPEKFPNKTDTGAMLRSGRSRMQGFMHPQLFVWGVSPLPHFIFELWGRRGSAKFNFSQVTCRDPQDGRQEPADSISAPCEARGALHQTSSDSRIITLITLHQLAGKSFPAPASTVLPAVRNGRVPRR